MSRNVTLVVVLRRPGLRLLPDNICDPHLEKIDYSLDDRTGIRQTRSMTTETAKWICFGVAATVAAVALFDSSPIPGPATGSFELGSGFRVEIAMHLASPVAFAALVAFGCGIVLHAHGRSPKG